MSSTQATNDHTTQAAASATAATDGDKPYCTRCRKAGHTLSQCRGSRPINFKLHKPKTAQPAVQAASVATGAAAPAAAQAAPVAARVAAAPGPVVEVKRPERAVHPRPAVKVGWEGFLARNHGYQLRVPKSREDVISSLKKKNIPIVITDAELSTSKINPHLESALVREQAIKTGFAALGCLHPRPKTVLNLFGSHNEEGLWDTIVGDVEDPPILGTYRPMITPKDYARHVRREIVAEVVEGKLTMERYPDACFIVDTYALGEQPLTPPALARFVSSKPTVLVLQRFEGRYGGSGPSSWIRGPEGLIHARPDRESQPWTPHPPLDCIHRDGATNELVWTVWASVDNYDIIIVYPNQFHIPTAICEDPLGCTQVDLPDPLIFEKYSWLPNIFLRALLWWNRSTTPYWVDTATMATAKRGLNPKSASSWSLKAALHAGETYGANKAPWAFVDHPQFCHDHAYYASLAAWQTGFNVRGMLADLTLAETDDSATRINAAYTHIGGRPRPIGTTWRNIGLITLGATALYALPLILWKSLRFGFQHQLFSWVAPLVTVNIVPHVFPGPIIEECVKKLHWTLPWAIAFWEIACYALTGPTNKQLLAVSLLKILFHVGVSKLPLLAAICFHTGWNYGVWRAAATMNPWTNFVEEFYLSNPEDRDFSNLDDIKPCTSLVPLDKAFVPRQVAAYYQLPKRDPKIVISGQFLHDQTPSVDQVLFILPVSVPVLVPGHCADMHTAAVVSRILAPAPFPDATMVTPTRDEIESAEKRRDWQLLKTLFRILISNIAASYTEHYGVIVTIDGVDYFFLWLCNYPSGKRPLMNRSRLQLEAGSPPSKVANINAKTDEALVKTTEDFKPRAIWRLDPKWQVLLGPVFFELTKRLKAAINGVAFTIARHRVTPLPEVMFFFASGSTDYELSKFFTMAVEWVKEPHNDHWAVMAAGDDSYVLHSSDKVSLEAYASDFSKFDQSQGSRHNKMMLELAVALGMTEEDARLYIEMASSRGCVAYSKKQAEDNKVMLDFSNRQQRLTGGPDTTFSNTFMTLSAWYLAISELLVTPNNLQASGGHIQNYMEEQFGFSVKMQHGDYNDLSFLEGVFMPAEFSEPWPSTSHVHGYAWVPCPSRFIKIGKTLVDPRTIYGVSELLVAARYFLEDIASCYRPYSDVPVLGAFVKRYYNPKHKVTPEIESLLRRKDLVPYSLFFEELKTSQTYDVHPLVHRGFYDEFARYYKEDIPFHELDAQIACSEPFMFLEHHGYVVLAKRDY